MTSGVSPCMDGLLAQRHGCSILLCCSMVRRSGICSGICLEIKQAPRSTPALREIYTFMLHHDHVMLQILGIGFVLNFLWEMLQMDLYTDGAGRPYAIDLLGATAGCLLASIGDVLVIGVVYLLGWVHVRRSDWIRNFDWWSIVLIVGGLVLLAIIIELVSVDMLRLWGYTDAMPLVPVVNVGLFPTIQLALLTLLTFAIVGWGLR